MTVVLLDPQSYMTFNKKAEAEPDQNPLPLAEQGAVQAEGQPSWPEVAATLDKSAMKPTDAPDAHEAEEDEDPEPVDDLLDDDMDPSEVSKLVDIPNPVTPPRKKRA